MKKLMIVAILVPTFSFGQKLEFSEMCGISLAQPIIAYGTYTWPEAGFSDRFVASYYFNSVFSLGAVFGLDSWESKHFTSGITANAQFKWAYVGAEISRLSMQQKTYQTSDGWNNMVEHVISYHPALQVGAHAGLRQRLVRNVYIREEIDSYWANVTSKTDNLSNVTNKFRYSAILVGLSYRFPIKHSTAVAQAQ
jgi:hypothetical protein